MLELESRQSSGLALLLLEQCAAQIPNHAPEMSPPVKFGNLARLSPAAASPDDYTLTITEIFPISHKRSDEFSADLRRAANDKIKPFNAVSRERGVIFVSLGRHALPMAIVPCAGYVSAKAVAPALIIRIRGKP